MIRVAVATLADAVTVREDLLNVLSAGISTIVLDEVPSNVKVSVAFMLEVSGSDLESSQRRTVRFAIGEMGSDVYIVEGDGRVAWEASGARGLNIPMPIDVPSIPIERAGAYVVAVEIEGVPRVEMPLTVLLSES